MRYMFAVIGFCLVLSVQATAQQAETQKAAAKPSGEVKKVSPEITRRFAALYPRLQPTAKSWVDKQAKEEAQKTAVDLRGLEIAIRGRFGGSNNSNNNELSDSDIQAIAFIVMMEATNDMDADLKAIMAELKSMTAAKQKLRDLIDEVNKDVANNAGKPDAPCLTPLCRSLASQFDQLAVMTANLPKPVRLQAPPKVTHGNLRAIQNDLKGKLDSMNEVSEMTSLRLQMLMDRRSKFITTLSNIMKSISTTEDAVVGNLK